MSESAPYSDTRQEEDERFHALADLSPDILSIFDAEGRLVFNSAAAWKTHGYHPEDMEGRSTFEFIHPEDRAVVQEAFGRLLSQPSEPVTVRYRYRHANGSYTWMEASGRNELGNPKLKGIISISRDISDRVRTEESLQREERQFRMLFASNPHPMIIVDQETHRIVEANKQACLLYGYSHEEMLCLDVWSIRPREEHARFARQLELARSRPDDEAIQGSFRHCGKDGRVIEVETLAQRIQWKERVSYLVLIQNVTEQLRLQAKLQQMQKLESLGLLAGGIAHDFNNLLTVILGHTSLAISDAEPGSAIQESLGHVQETTLRAADLCRQMLAYSGKGRFQVQAIHLGEFVRRMGDWLRGALKPGAQLVLDLQEGLPAMDGDPSQLQQVLMNLVLNASESLGGEGGTVRVRTSLVQADLAMLESGYLAAPMAEGDYLCLQVSDTGGGMDAEVLSRIFDPFFSTKFTGRGLGLAAVLGIVRGHHGVIRVESSPGKGSCFTVLFPPSKEAGASVGATTGPTGVVSAAKGRTVLIVDDEAGVRGIAQAILKRQGLRVLLAADGADGVARFREHAAEVDLVLMDLTMPRLGGVEAMREILMLNPRARVILMSGYDETVEGEKYRGLGHVGFLQKPFCTETLMAKLLAGLGA